MEKTYIYFHVKAVNNWKDVVNSCFTQLEKYNVFDHICQLRVCLLGEINCIKDPIWNFNKKICIYIYHNNINLDQGFSLNKIKKDSSNSKEPFNLFYMHSLGTDDNQQHNSLIKKNNIKLNDLISANFIRFKHMHKLIYRYDVVGTNLDNNYGAHYQDNFWWSKSNHIKSLQKPLSIKKYDNYRWILSKLGTTCVNIEFTGKIISRNTIKYIVHEGDSNYISYPIFQT